MCADHNLLPEGRMSYSELFLMLAFFFFPNKFKAPKLGGWGGDQDMLALAGFCSGSSF